VRATPTCAARPWVSPLVTVAVEGQGARCGGGGAATLGGGAGLGVGQGFGEGVGISGRRRRLGRDGGGTASTAGDRWADG
jgi:hypothetical protein